MGCYCNFGCNCDCSGDCGPCGCSSCTGNCNVDGSEGGASPILADIDNNSDVVANEEKEQVYLNPRIGGHYVNYAPHYRKEMRSKFSNLATLNHMYGSHQAEVMKGSYEFTYDPYAKMGFGSGGWARDTQCGFDQKSQQWVDVKCGFDNNCGFDFECGFDAECGFDVVKNTKCGFDLAREAAGCGFDAKSNTWVNVQCGFDNNCGFDIKA